MRLSLIGLPNFGSAVVPIPGPDSISQWYLEKLKFRSGCPERKGSNRKFYE